MRGQDKGGQDKGGLDKEGLDKEGLDKGGLNKRFYGTSLIILPRPCVCILVVLTSPFSYHPTSDAWVIPVSLVTTLVGSENSHINLKNGVESINNFWY